MKSFGDSVQEMEIKVGGLVCKVREPLMEDSEKFSEEFEAAGDNSKKGLEAMKNFVVSLGVPREALPKLSEKEFGKLFSYLRNGDDSKKN